MSLDSNNNSLNNHSYENLLQVYRAARASSAEETQAQFTSLPESFRQKIFDKLSKNSSDQEGKEEWTEVGVFDNLPALQQAIQQIAQQEMQTLPETINHQANFLCSKGRAQDLTEAHLMCLKARCERDELVRILDEWVAQGSPDEYREGAKKEFLLFIDEPGRTALLLSGYDLKSLPPVFDKKPFVNQLRLLQLVNNQLRTLPQEIGHLQNLTYLGLSGNQLCKLPEEICELRNLMTLDVEDNYLAGLPENIGNLFQLHRLQANNNPLTDYPEGIFDLSEDCDVEFSRTLLSDRDIQRIIRHSSFQHYQGPTIIYSQRKGESLFQLNQFLKNHYPEPRLALSYFPDLINDPKTHLIMSHWPQNISQNKHHILTEWLRRVSFSLDYEESLHETIEHVISAMELAQADPLYREKFWEIVEEATTNCGDRGALSLVRLGRWKRIMNADTQNIKEFANVVASVWPLEILDRIAAHKIEQIKADDPDFHEDTQVFLEYPIKLKAPLSLDIDAEQNYFSVESRVTENDLDLAEAFVKKLEANQREKCRFLFNEPLWFNVFAKAYPEEIKGIEDYIEWKMDKLDGNENSTKEDYDKLKKQREEMFIALIAFKLSLEIPEQPLEEITDWETELHQTFGIADEPVASSSANSFEELADSALAGFDSDSLPSFSSDAEDNVEEQEPNSFQLAGIADLIEDPEIPEEEENASEI